jgi:hypothetical protein
MNSETSEANVVSRTAQSITVHLELAPYQSQVLVLHREAPSEGYTHVATTRALADLSAGWTVRFGDAQPARMDRLASWIADESTRYFSGIAVYEREFEAPAHNGAVELDFGGPKPLPAVPLKAGMQAWLDAPVREVAIVHLNGERIGSVWSPPYRLDVTRGLKPGVNRLRIEVANLALNAMAARPLPSYKLLNLRYGVRFEAQDMDKVQPVDAGLLGQIRLMGE